VAIGTSINVPRSLENGVIVAVSFVSTDKTTQCLPKQHVSACESSSQRITLFSVSGRWSVNCQTSRLLALGPLCDIVAPIPAVWTPVASVTSVIIVESSTLGLTLREIA
jgi:hypothetical protein